MIVCVFVNKKVTVVIVILNLWDNFNLLQVAYNIMLNE